MLKAKQTALVLIDVQEKLATHMHDHEGLFDGLVRIVRGIRALDIPILWCEQNPAGLGATLPQITQYLDGIEPISKTCFSCYRSKKFQKRLMEVNPRQILLAGIETHVCVYQTAAQLAEDGYEVQVISDAVSSRTAGNHTLGLRRMESLGIAITGVEMALFELMKDADHPAFKDILQIVK